MSKTPSIGAALVLVLIFQGCGSTAVEEQKADVLFRVTAEPAGERCPSGGETALVGFDLNGDGILSTDEVGRQEAFCLDYCTPREGLLIIESEADWQELVESGCRVISGSVKIAVPDSASLSLVAPMIRISGDLLIEGNTELEDLVGLDSLTEIGGRLSVSDNPALLTLTGLDALSLVRGSVTIHYNDVLVDFEGLRTLSRVGGRFVVKNNRSLESMFGMGPLGSVGEFLRIAENPAMESLRGLGFVASIGGDLRIDRNHRLTDIAHLLALRSLGGDLIILDNTALPECEALSLRDRLAADAWSNEARVEGNDANAACP